MATQHTGQKGLAFDLDGDTFVDDGLEEGAHLVGGDFAEVVGGGGAVDGVGHDLAGAQETDDVEHRGDDGGVGGVEVGGMVSSIDIGIGLAAEEAPLEDEVAVELLEGFNNTGDVVARSRVVYLGNQLVGGGINFHDGVVDLAEGGEDLGDVDAGGVAEDRDLGMREVAVAESQGVVDDLRELRVEGGFAVAAEGDGVDGDIVGDHILEFVAEVVTDLGGGGDDGVVATVAIPSTFAVDAVEVAEFTFLGEKVDAEGVAQSAAMDWSEDRFFTKHF